MKLTKAQLHVLAHVDDTKQEYVSWFKSSPTYKWVLYGRNVSPTVYALERMGLIEYGTDGLAICDDFIERVITK
jgi:hypothetical protein